MAQTAKSFEVELDSRRRLSLAKLKSLQESDRFEVTPLDDGRLVLTPMASISTMELAMLQNPDEVRAIRKAVADTETAIAEGTLVDFKDVFGSEPGDGAHS
jgi:hypothetical protein